MEKKFSSIKKWHQIYNRGYWSHHKARLKQGRREASIQCKNFFFWDKQLWIFVNARLLNKSYENEVTLREQDICWKCCQPLELLTYIKRGFRYFHTGNKVSVGQRAAKLPYIKLWEWFEPRQNQAWAKHAWTHFGCNG